MRKSLKDVKGVEVIRWKDVVDQQTPTHHLRCEGLKVEKEA